MDAWGYFYECLIFCHQILSVGAEVGEVEAGKKVMNHNGFSFCWCSCINNIFGE